MATTDRHYHVYVAEPFGPVSRFTTRRADVFAGRSRANDWAAEHRPETDRRMVRACDGGPACPFPPPQPGERVERPAISMRMRKPTRRPAPLRDQRREADAWVMAADGAERTRRAQLLREATRAAISAASTA